jgi:hypothetical protein
MGILTDYIIAPRSAAKEICAAAGAHANRWPTLQLKGVETLKLSGILQLLSLPSESRAMAEGKLILCYEEEGPWVYEVPTSMVHALAEASPERLEQLCSAWSQSDAVVYDTWTREDCVLVVQELSALFRKAAAEQSAVLLWVCL